MTKHAALAYLRGYLLKRYRRGVLFTFVLGPLCLGLPAGFFTAFPYGSGLPLEYQIIPGWLGVVVTALLIGMGLFWFLTPGIMYIKSKSLLRVAETSPHTMVWIYNEVTTTTKHTGPITYKSDDTVIVLADNHGKKYRMPGGNSDDQNFWNAATTVFDRAHQGFTNYLATLYEKNPAMFLGEIERQGLRN
jgi:hypothetical protein